VLHKILAHKQAEIAGLDLAALKRAAQQAPAPRPFLPPVSEGGRVRLVAELKRASPSKGLLAPGADMLALARTYAENGAAALSVLTDERFFMGSLDTLRRLRREPHGLPLLRKDFILAPEQVYESRAAGADAMLLIAAALPDDYGRCGLHSLHALALDLGLTPLVEVHTRPELERVVALDGLRLVGINNRDLHTFNVSLETTAELRPLLPPGVGVVSESGISTAEHMARLRDLNVDAALVGEALVTAPDVGAKVRELASGQRAIGHGSLPLANQQ
jgi:indole-3-glycerol phosphate synthase